MMKIEIVFMILVYKLVLVFDVTFGLIGKPLIRKWPIQLQCQERISLLIN
jgi:hypothetical protein